MEVLNKENKTNRQNEFEKLLSKDLSQRKFSEGEVIEMMEREEAEEWAALDEARREAWEYSTGSI